MLKLLTNVSWGSYEIPGEEKLRSGGSNSVQAFPSRFISQPALLKNETKEIKLNINS